MRIKATIISVSLEVDAKKQDGGSYKAFQIVYKDDEGKVKDFTKPVQGLRYKPKLKARLADLKAGEDVTLVVEKNASGYLELMEVELGHSATTSTFVPKEGPASATTVNSAASKGNWETAEERAFKQRLIVRQSCLSNAITIVKSDASVYLAPKEVMAVAEELENWVFRDNDKGVK